MYQYQRIGGLISVSSTHAPVFDDVQLMICQLKIFQTIDLSFYVLTSASSHVAAYELIWVALIYVKLSLVTMMRMMIPQSQKFCVKFDFHYLISYVDHDRVSQKR